MFTSHVRFRTRLPLILLCLVTLGVVGVPVASWAQGSARTVSIANDRLAIQVRSAGPDSSRFNIGADPDPATGDATLDSWDLSFAWPIEPWSSYTTIRINDTDYRYGEDGGGAAGPHPHRHPGHPQSPAD